MSFITKRDLKGIAKFIDLKPALPGDVGTLVLNNCLFRQVNLGKYML